MSSTDINPDSPAKLFALNADEQFFWDNAGWGYDPRFESAEAGHLRCAQALIAAERWAYDNGYTVEWTDDESEDHSYLDQPEFAGHDVQTCESATLWGPAEYSSDGEHTGPQFPEASLGCIDNATPEYRRVVEAELALDVMPV